jgi:S-adenosylmethionine hydrolase
MSKSPIITILTDFGQRDAYVAAMKGTILELAPNAKIIDIAHDLTRYNIIQAAFILLNSSKYFPRNTIHLVVVDPGVGTERRRIIVQGNRSYYVGPDNGVLSLAIQEEGLKKIILISERKYMRSNVTATFEGRDIFAPVAAHLAQGVPIESFGRKVDQMIQLRISQPLISNHHISGKIIHIDGFGNIITNITYSQIHDLITIGEKYQVTINQLTKTMKYMKSYGYVSPGELIIITGSSNYMEISINQGNAQKLFNAMTGDPIAITTH